MARDISLIVVLTLAIGQCVICSNLLPAAWIESGNNSTLPGRLVYHSVVEDSRGNLWLFGGIDPLFPDVAFNDVYKLEMRSGYVWVPIEPAVGSLPAPRGNFMMWIDPADNIYIYGGTSNYDHTEYYSDLWRFNTTSSQWTRLRDGSARNSGSLGEGTSSTHPGPRANTAAWFEATSNSLWLFGGRDGSTAFADVWKYALDDGLWTWVAGQSQGNAVPAPTVQPNVPSTTASPGAAWNAATARDGNGVVWFYGGQYPLAGNQLWTFKPATLEWTWVSGDLNTTVPIPPTFGTTGQYSAAVYPPTTTAANLVYSGQNLLTLTLGGYVLNDQSPAVAMMVWSYDIAAGQWAFIFGHQTDSLVSPVYWSQQQADALNDPGSRLLFATSLTRGNSWVIRGWDGNQTALIDIFVYAVNKCQTDLNPCDTNAQCVDQLAYVDCTCNEGYLGDGFDCFVVTPATPPYSPPISPPRAPLSPTPRPPISAPTGSNPNPSSPTVESPVVDTTPNDIEPPLNANVTGPLGNEVLPLEMIIPAIVVPVVVIAVGIILLVVLLKKRKKSKRNNKNDDTKQQLEPVDTYFSVMPVPRQDNDTNSSTLASPLYAANIDRSSPQTTNRLEASEISTTSRIADDRMNIPYSDIKFVREIGAGAYGKVFIGEWQKTTVALKISSASSTEEFLREAGLLINLRPHPNVVQILGISASTDGVNVVMMMEYCDGGSLDKLVNKKNLTFEMKIHYLAGIAKGVYHLHKNKIIHRDLAARNILLSRGNEAKITDFGMSRKVTDAAAPGTTKSTVGPIRWMAPESLRTSQYSTKSDVWSFGILCWEVLAGQEPHLNADPLAIGIAIRDSGVTPAISPDWNEEVISLLKDCWKIDPAERPEFEEICERICELTYDNNTIAKSKFR